MRMAWSFDEDYTLVVLAKIAAPELAQRTRAYFDKQELELEAREGGNGWNILLLRCADSELGARPDGKPAKKNLRGLLADLAKQPLHYAIGYVSIIPYLAQQVGKKARAPRDIFDLAEELGSPIADRPPSVIVEEPKRGDVDTDFYEAIVFTSKDEPAALVRSTINTLGYDHRGPRRTIMLRGSRTTHAILSNDEFPDEVTALLNKVTGTKVVKLNADDDINAWSVIDHMVQ